MAEPALRLLADAGLDVIAIGRPWTSELLASAPVRVEPVVDPAQEADLYRSSGAAWGVGMRSSFTTAWQMRRAGLKVIGRRGNMRRLLLHRALAKRLDGHRVDELLDLASAVREEVLGAPLERESPAVRQTPRLTPTEAQLEAARATCQQAGVGRTYAMCCPTAGHKRPSSFKIWPQFPAFMRAQIAAGVEVVVCPGRGEMSWYTGPPDGVRVIEDVGVGCLLGMVSLATSMVSNDTGPAHLAAAAGIPTLTVFGDTDPARYSPRGPRARHIGSKGSWPSLDEGWAAWQGL